MDISEEKTLLEGCISGDKDSWDQFVLNYTKLIYNVIYRTLDLKGYQIQSDLIEDLHQEIFLSLLKNDSAKLKSFGWKRKCSLATWLRVVTRNLVLNYIRDNIEKNKLLKSIDEKIGEDFSLADTLKDNNPTSRELAGSSDLLNRMYEHIEKLDPSEKIILDMFYIQELPLEDIAKTVGKSVDAIFMQKKRVITKMQSLMQKDVGF